jgi:hypothetical protein
LEGATTGTNKRAHATPIPGQVRDFKSGPIHAQPWRTGSDPAVEPITMKEQSTPAVLPIDVRPRRSKAPILIGFLVSAAAIAGVAFYVDRNHESTTTSNNAVPQAASGATPLEPKPEDKLVPVDPVPVESKAPPIENTVPPVENTVAPVDKDEVEMPADTLPAKKTTAKKPPNKKVAKKPPLEKKDDKPPVDTKVDKAGVEPTPPKPPDQPAPKKDFKELYETAHPKAK